MAHILSTRDHSSASMPRLNLDKRRVIMPDGVVIQLQPMECSLYRLFLNHPEGIKAANMTTHREELALIYASETRYDDLERQRVVVDTICDRTKRAFYVCVSRIKKRFVAAIGVRKAEKYIISRNKAGLYRIRVCIAQNNSIKL